jgi:hypothetical protein
MREQEMRDRINQYLKIRMRGMLVPALGISLLAVGCKKEGVTAVYSAPMPDAGQDQAAQVLPDAMVSKDTSPSILDAASSNDLAAPDTGTDTPSPDGSVVPRPDTAGLDSATTLDAGAAPDADKSDGGKPDAGKVDAGIADAPSADTGRPVDAGRLDGLVTKYIAQLPDGGMIGTLYMAQMP